MEPTSSLPNGVELIKAGPLQEGQICPCCQTAIGSGIPVGRCPSCGHIQHGECWLEAQRCCSYLCELATARSPEDLQPGIIVTSRDIERVVSTLPYVKPPTTTEKPQMSTLAVASFVLAILGVLLLGLPGLLAVALGAVALGPTALKRRKRGTWLAVTGIIIGVADVVGWSLVAVSVFGPLRKTQPSQQVLQPIGTSLLAEDLTHTPEAIRRAIEANVLIVTRQGRNSWEGSGIILERRDNRVFTLTNRHVIEGTGDQNALGIEITYFDGARSEAQLVWSGEEGLDLAVLSSEGTGKSSSVALSTQSRPLASGQSVFAIGNPFGLGWSLSTGVISALRQQSWSGRRLRVIQTQTPLNPGNSGGGLYDVEGRLIGINTMNADKTRTEGIGFAIAFEDVLPALIEEAGLNLRSREEGK